MKRGLAMLLAAIVAAALVVDVACSPEATRTRGGGPGADVGNHGPSLYQPATPPPIPGG